MTRDKTNTKLNISLMLITGFVFLLTPFPVWAQGNIHFGRLAVEPSLMYKGQYNDNIYSAASNEDEDFIHTLTPNIDFVYQGSEPDNFVRFGGGVDVVAYTDFDENNYETLRPYISLGYKSPMGFSVKASENYLYTADPYGDRNSFGLGDPQTKRWTNTFDLTLGYEFNRYAIEGLYRNYIIDYERAKDDWQDRLDHLFGLAFFFKVTPKTAVFAQYRATVAEYKEQNDGVDQWTSSTSQDYALNDFFIGARFTPGGKLSGEVKLGWGEKKFENTQDKDGNTYADVDSWVAETNVSFQAASRTLLQFTLQRANLGTPDGDATSFLDTTAGLSVTQGLISRLSFLAGISWNNNDYENEAAGNPEKSFDLYTYNLGLNYEIKDWLHAGLDYYYKNKEASDSQYQNSEFENNTMAFWIAGYF